MNPIHLIWIIPISVSIGILISGLLRAAKDTSELEAAYREGRVDIRPNCEECKHQFTHYSLDPCYQCKGQTAIGEKGWMFEPKDNERALSEASAGEGAE